MDKKHQYKYSIEELNTMVNAIVNSYYLERSKVRQSFLISDLLEITAELIHNVCNKYVSRYSGCTALSLELLKEEAKSTVLTEALRDFDKSRGIDFIAFWIICLKNKFKNMFTHNCTAKATKIERAESLDIEVNEDGATYQVFCGEDDFVEPLLDELVIKDLFKEFEETEKTGDLVECLMINNKQLRKLAICKKMNIEKYGDKEKKQVSRLKARFAKFLTTKGICPA